MSELIAVGFHGKHRAAEVLDELIRLDDEARVDLEDGVAAYRRDNGRFRIEASLYPTGAEGASMGGALGIMVGALLAAPFTAGVSAAVAGAAIGAGALTGATAGAALGAADAIDYKTKYGITDDFVRQVGGMVQPGDSAVFALIQANNRKKVEEHFRRYGGTVLRTTLSPKAEAQLQETLRA